MSVKSTAIAARTTKIKTYYPLSKNTLSDIKDILLKFLRHYFTQMPTDQFQYTPDTGPFTGGTSETVTEVIITDQGSLGTDTIEKRPVIIVSRTPLNYANLGLDNMLEHNLHTGKRKHTDMMTGQFVINCISRIGLEAETLALSVGKAIKYFRRELQKYGFFQIGQRITIGSESPANAFVSGDSDEDFINVPVSFPFYYQETWSIQPTAQTLSKISVTVNSIARKLNGSLLFPDSIDSNGEVNSSSDGVVIQRWESSTS